MLYHAYQAQSDSVSPLRLLAQHQSALLRLRNTEGSALRKISAALEVFSHLRLTHTRPAYGITHVTVDGQAIQVVEENVFELSAADRAERGILQLPGSLIEAIEVAEETPFLRSALGDHVFESLIQNKRIEWERYRRHISDFELSEYLPVL